VVQLVVEPSAYVQVAMSWLVVPTGIEVTPPVVARESELSPSVLGPLTVTTNGGVPTMPPVIVALMVAVPMLTPLARPELLTVSTAEFAACPRRNRIAVDVRRRAVSGRAIRVFAIGIDLERAAGVHGVHGPGLLT